MTTFRLGQSTSLTSFSFPQGGLPNPSRPNVDMLQRLSQNPLNFCTGKEKRVVGWPSGWHGNSATHPTGFIDNGSRVKLSLMQHVEVVPRGHAFALAFRISQT